MVVELPHFSRQRHFAFHKIGLAIKKARERESLTADQGLSPFETCARWVHKDCPQPKGWGFLIMNLAGVPSLVRRSFVPAVRA